MLRAFMSRLQTSRKRDWGRSASSNLTCAARAESAIFQEKHKIKKHSNKYYIQKLIQIELQKERES